MIFTFSLDINEEFLTLKENVFEEKKKLLKKSIDKTQYWVFFNYYEDTDKNH